MDFECEIAYSREIECSHKIYTGEHQNIFKNMQREDKSTLHLKTHDDGM